MGSQSMVLANLDWRRVRRAGANETAGPHADDHGERGMDERSPPRHEIERALLAHVHGGPSPEPVIRAALHPLGASIHAIGLHPGKGKERPTYSLKIMGLGLRIERQSVKRVAARLHEVSTALAGLRVGDQARLGAPVYLVTRINAQQHIRADCEGDVRAAIAALSDTRLATVHAPVALSEIEEACCRALEWARRPGNLPPGLLRFTGEARLFLDRARLEAVRACIGLPVGTIGRVVLSLTRNDAPEIALEASVTAHARIEATERLRQLGETLAQDRRGWLEGSISREIEVAPVCLSVRIEGADGAPDIRLGLSDADGRAVGMSANDASSGRALDPASIGSRSLLHALRPPGLRRWMVELSDKPGAPLVPFVGTSLAEALAMGSPEGASLDHAMLSGLLGHILARRAGQDARPTAFVARPGPDRLYRQERDRKSKAAGRSE